MTQVTLKIIPGVDGEPAIVQLMGYNLSDLLVEQQFVPSTPYTRPLPVVAGRLHLNRSPIGSAGGSSASRSSSPTGRH